MGFGFRISVCFWFLIISLISYILNVLVGLGKIGPS